MMTIFSHVCISTCVSFLKQKEIRVNSFSILSSCSFLSAKRIVSHKEGVQKRGCSFSLDPEMKKNHGIVP